MSDATYTKVGIIEETTFGTTPSASLQLVNASSFPFTRPRAFGRPNVFTQDRRRFPHQVLQEDGALTIPAPMQYQNLLLLYEGLQANDIATAFNLTASDVSVATGVVATVGGSMSGLQDGDLVFHAGFAESANNGWKGPISSVGASSYTVPTGQVTDESAGASVTVDTQRLIDAETAKSFSAEWQDTKLTNRFRNGTGYRVANGTWTWRQGEYVNESFTLAGQAPAKAAATIGTGGDTAAPDTSFMTAVQDWGELYIDEAATSIIVSELELSVTNVQNMIYGLGNLGPQQIIEGNQEIALGFTCLYNDDADAILANIENHDTLGLWWNTVDKQGNKIAFSLPALKADDGQPDIGEPGTQISFPVSLSGHDAEKDDGSTYNDSAFGLQFGVYFVGA